jgi:hypothetical protein
MNAAVLACNKLVKQLWHHDDDTTPTMCSFQKMILFHTPAWSSTITSVIQKIIHINC